MLEIMKKVFMFIHTYSGVFLILVGCSAFIVYWLKERKKEIKAASLIVLQIQEFQNKLREISTYIVDKKLNFTAFYESLPLIEDNYWSKYKHLFVKKMDNISYSTLNLLYDYVIEIQEQQSLIKKLQKEHFFILQKSIIKAEMQTIYNYLNVPNNGVEPDFNLVSNLYNQQKCKLENLINQNTITMYTPEQIRISMEKILTEWRSLEVMSCEGYEMLRKISKRKF